MLFTENVTFYSVNK